MKFNIYIIIFLLMMIGISCSETNVKLSEPGDGESIQSNLTDTLPNPKEEVSRALPSPIKAKYIDPDSIAPLIEVPLRGKPKVVPAHTNVHPVGTPEVIQIPKDLMVVTPGKDGIPLPTVIPAIGKTVTALQPKPIPAPAPRYKENAIYDIQIFPDDQGMGIPYVPSILEDSRGHIWFGTLLDGGAYRYDGNNYFHYTEKEGFLTSTVSIIEDSKGRIWFAGNSGGICYFDGQNVTHFTKEEGLEGDYSSALMEDKKGRIWFANGKAVYCYNPNVKGTGDQNFTIFKEENGLINNLDPSLSLLFEYEINDIIEDSRGHLWWATNGSGVMRYDGESITQFTEKEGLIDNYIFYILEDSKGPIWFGSGGVETTARGVSRYDPAGGSFTNFTKKEGLSDNRIQSILEDERGNIWFATYAGGLNRYDGKVFTHFTTEEGLSDNSVRSIMEDGKGNIWVGTNGGGISRMQPNGFAHFTEKQGLSKNWITSIFEDSKGNIWMGTLYGGVIKYDGINFTHFTEQNGLLQNAVNFIMEDSKGRIWFCTRDKGVSIFDGKAFSEFTMDQGLAFHYLWDIHKDSEGNIWVVCGWGGITRYNPDNGEITHFTGDYNRRFTGEDSHGLGGGSIIEDSQQNLWFGSKGYIAKYDDENDQINFLYQVDEQILDSYLEDKQGNLWFGGEERLIRLNKDGEKMGSELTIFTEENGLPNLLIKWVVADKEQNIWISSNEGLAVFLNGTEDLGQSKLKWIKYDKADGLRGNSRWAFLDSKNRLWRGSTTDGVAILDLNTFQSTTEAPEIDLSYIEIQQQFVDYSGLTDATYRNSLDFGEALSQSFDSVVAFNNYPATMSLPYDLNHLTFHFSAIDWAAPHKIQYSYRMEGLDKEWSVPGKEVKADFRNLPYGNFTLSVKAIGEAQDWSEVFDYVFTIRPPWWHTWWARALYAFGALLCMYSFVQWRTKSLKKRQKELEKTVSDRTAEVVAQKDKLEFQKDELANQNVIITKEKERSEELLLNILPAETAEELKKYGSAKAKNYDTVTVLFTDFKGFTQHAEKLSPEELVAEIDHCFKAFDRIMEQYNIEKIKTIGDAYMAAAGLPTANTSNPVDAVMAALAIRGFMMDYKKEIEAKGQDPFEIRIGVHTGPVVAGIVGIKKFAYDIWGDTVNLASRMESSGTVGKVNISEHTYKLLKENSGFTFVSRGKIKAKNKGEIEMYFVERKHKSG